MREEWQGKGVLPHDITHVVHRVASCQLKSHSLAHGVYR